MRILVLGDPHGKVPKNLPRDVDLILLTGDLGRADLARKMAFQNIERKKLSLEEIEYSPKQKKRAFMESYSSSMKVVKFLSSISPVFTIYGNVEHRNYETRRLSKEIGLKLPFLTDDLSSINGVRVINNRVANFKGLRIGGLDYFIDTSWVMEFKPSDYREKLRNARDETEKARGVLSRFNSLDILVCHQPPYRVLDKVTAKFAPKHWKGKHAGSKVILEYIRKRQPKYVFCGHIHEGEGHKKIGRTDVYNLGVGRYKVINL